MSLPPIHQPTNPIGLQFRRPEIPPVLAQNFMSRSQLAGAEASCSQLKVLALGDALMEISDCAPVAATNYHPAARGRGP